MKLRTYITLAILLLLILGIFADIEDQEGKNKKKKSKTSKAPSNKKGTEKWNIMVYMMGNNVLSCETENSIQQMAAISDTGNNYQFTIMWQMSLLNYQCGNDTFMGVEPFEGARIYTVGKSSLTLIKDLGNVNTATAQTLNYFIVDAIKSWDATHHVLIFYGYGGGLVYGLDDHYINVKKTTAKKTTAKKTTAKKTTAKKTAKKTTAKKTAKKTTAKKTAKKTTAKKTAKKTTAKKTAKKTTAKKTAKKTTAKKTAKKTGKLMVRDEEEVLAKKAKKTTAKKTAKKTTAKKTAKKTTAKKTAKKTTAKKTAKKTTAKKTAKKTTAKKTTAKKTTAKKAKSASPEAPGTEFAVGDLPKTIRAALDKVYPHENMTLDIVGFDASLMGLAEATQLFSGVADYIISSAEIETGQWNYAAWKVLNQASYSDSDGLSTKEVVAQRTMLGKTIIDDYFSLNPNFATATLAISQTAYAMNLTQTINDLGALFSELLMEPALLPIVWNTHYYALEFSDTLDYGVGSGTIDLGTFLLFLIIEVPNTTDYYFELTGAAFDVFTQVENTVLYSQSSGLVAGSAGLSLFFPGTAQLYNGLSPLYKTSFPFFNNWIMFLDEYFGLVIPDIDIVDSKVVSNDKKNKKKGTSALATYQITTDLDAYDLVEVIYAKLSVGLIFDTTHEDYHYIVASYNEQQNSDSFVSNWNGYVWLMQNGGNTYNYIYAVQPAYSNTILEIPLGVDQPDKSRIVVVAFAETTTTTTTKKKGKKKVTSTTTTEITDFFVYFYPVGTQDGGLKDYNSASYALVSGSTLVSIFPVFNSSSGTYVGANLVQDYSSYSGMSFAIETNDVKLTLVSQHWTDIKYGEIKSFASVLVLQQLTNAMGTTTIQSFTADLSDPYNLVAGKTTYQGPGAKTGKAKTTAKKTTAKKTAKKTTAKKTAKKTTAKKTAKKTTSKKTAKKTTAKKTAKKTTAKKTAKKTTAKKTAKKTTA